ncbi:hypothetical protein BY458DRAFT_523405 [Sporodiniella umbellata]|nr:hypothetical protein BY458DRAFT_523405 [Sporodiniella umbellata]
MPTPDLHVSDGSLVSYYKSFVNPVDNTFKTLTYSDVDRITTNLACEWSDKVKDAGVISYIDDHKVDYCITMIALLKLRSTLFNISPRNSESAVAYLLEKSGSNTLIVSLKYKPMAIAASSQIKDISVHVTQPLDLELLLSQPLNKRYKDILSTRFDQRDLDKVAKCICSSGSTGLPKPIFLDNRYLINAAGYFRIFKERYPQSNVFEKNNVSLANNPLFHVAGIDFNFSPMVEGGSIAFLKSIPASAEEIMHTLESNKCNVMVAASAFIEQIYRHLKNGGKISVVQRLNYLFSTGSSLKEDIGDWFHRNNVKIRLIYGSTESTICMSSNLNPNCNNWSSMSPLWPQSDKNKLYFFEDIDSNFKHLYLSPNYPNLALNVCNRQDGGFNTNDLFIEDSKAPGYYKYVGRRDDILVFDNGEKMNPLPLEATIRQSSVVKQVVILGSHRPCTVCLVEIDPSCCQGVPKEEIHSIVNMAVIDANRDCPNYGVILPQMVKILPLDSSLPCTVKGNIIRKKSEEMYKDIIEEMYKDFIEGPKEGFSSINRSLSSEETREFIIQSVADVLKLKRLDLENYTSSLFDIGFNSLLAIQLRNAIVLQFGYIPQNFLYEHTTIPSIQKALLRSTYTSEKESVEKNYQKTQDLTASYIDQAKTEFLVTRKDHTLFKKDQVIMLTGATGSLGCFILRDLLKEEKFKKIYCLIRGQESELKRRLIDVFRHQYLDTSLLETDRLELLPANLSEPHLGLSKEKYDQLKDQVTVVQHCAWLMDFNRNIEYYDKGYIAPFYNLIRFAYREVNPMHLHFISSVSASAAMGNEVPEEPLPFDSHVSLAMGYAQSKFVCEILLNYLVKEKNMPCYIERVGQMVGSNDSGVWNTTEMYPLLFAGGILMRKMPKLSTKVDWISVDCAAATITDILFSTSQPEACAGQFVYNIVNPKIQSWSSLLETIKLCGIEFDTVETTEWLEALSKDENNPSFPLMPFYEQHFKNSDGSSCWQTKRTCGRYPTLSQAPEIGPELFQKYLGYWRSVNFC